MLRNAVWIGLLLVLFGLGTWFALKAGRELNRYFRLSQQATVVVHDSWVEEMKKDAFVVKGKYSFEAGDREVQGEGVLSRAYPNRWAAEGVESRERTIWYNPKNPQEARFQRHFPYKTILSAAILLALLLYFFCLGLYVEMKRR